MKLSSNYDLISATPNPGGHASLWISDVLAQEAATAIDVGTGPTTPNSEGTPQAGNIVPGMVVSLNSAGYWDLATSPDLTATFPQPIGFVHGGDDDFDGAYLGKLVVLYGFAEFKTDQINGSTFVPGQVLVANAGKIEVKASFSGGQQVIGYVGNQGFVNGVLHVIFVPSTR